MSVVVINIAQYMEVMVVVVQPECEVRVLSHMKFTTRGCRSVPLEFDLFLASRNIPRVNIAGTFLIYTSA